MSSTTSHEPRGTPSLFAWLSLLVALATTAGSIWLSLGWKYEYGMKLKPCPLCYYQRTFVMGIAGMLLIGLLTGMNRQVPLSLLAMPLGVAGLAMAIFHVYLEASKVLECPAGLLGAGSAPQQSLGAFALLTLLLLVDACQRSNLAQGGALTILGGGILGVALAAGGVLSTPPSDKPTEEYKTPLNICRPPFKG